MGKYDFPEELADLAYGEDAPRSPRTVARWLRNGPPRSIEKLLKTAAGRKALQRWIAQYEASEGEPQAA